MEPTRFSLIYAPATRDHLSAVETRHLSMIRTALEQHLSYDPDVTTRNRKPLQRPFLEATWELRFGPGNTFRAFYDVDRDKRVVSIVAIGTKRGATLYVGREEVSP